MRVLVMGGTRFNGLALVRELVKAGGGRALGADGRKATAWTERAAIYGQLLMRCAACHAAIPPTGRRHASAPASSEPGTAPPPNADKP